MLVDAREKFLKRMAQTIRDVRQKEGPLAGAVRSAKLGLTKEDKTSVMKLSLSK